MFVLSRRSLLSAMHIAEKNVYNSIHNFNFSYWNFFPFCSMGKIPWDFFLKLLVSEKNNNGINSVDIQFYQYSEVIPIFQYLYFPVGNFPLGIFSHFARWKFLPAGLFPTGKNSYGIFQKRFQLHKCHVTVFWTVLCVYFCICSSIIYQISYLRCLAN